MNAAGILYSAQHIARMILYSRKFRQCGHRTGSDEQFLINDLFSRIQPHFTGHRIQRHGDGSAQEPDILPFKIGLIPERFTLRGDLIHDPMRLYGGCIR